jgi:hypothetical protein
VGTDVEAEDHVRAFLKVLCAVTLLQIVGGAAAHAAGGYPGHQAWADYHIAGLAPEIRDNVLRHRRECGTPFAATHAFRSPATPDAHFVTLHYENLWCASRGGGICRGANCLHEVYGRTGNHYRLIFRGYVSDVRVGPDGKIAIVRGAN